MTRRGKSVSKATLAAAVWRRLFDFIISTSAQRGEVLGRYGLTPNDSRALFALDSKGRNMQSLAKEWACDPSNATFIVDRLEERRLAERRPLDGDRRVKLVALTPLGIKTRAALKKDLYQPPPELLALERADLEVLLSAAAKLRAEEPDGRGAEDSGDEG
ncbi:MAG: MarR family transcriptional regulator [bacterium]|nr:MarR family transcriptional regulator [bacterium]